MMLSLLAEAIGYTVMSIGCLFAIVWTVRFIKAAILTAIISRCWREEHLHYKGQCLPKCRYCVFDREREERDALSSTQAKQ